MSKTRWLGVVLVVALVSCGPSVLRPKVRTDINGLPVDLSALSGGCGSIGVGTRPTQADIDLCKANLTPVEGATLQILWKFFDEVVTDGIHNVDTCPILTLYPLQQGHKNGTISDADFAKRLYKFYVAKYKQNLNGKQDACAAALKAAGLPLP